MFDKDNTLLVPIEVKALAVNASFGDSEVRRWRMNFFQMLRHNNPEPEPFHGEIEDGFCAKPRNWGVYLYWNLPQALRKGHSTAAGKTEFPPLPNRWAVLRCAEGGQHTKHWLIRSDELNEYSEGGSNFAYVDHSGATRICKLGRSYPLENALTITAETATFSQIGARFPKSLNALGYGDVNFLAYQPLVNDVFSFHDPLPRDNKGGLLDTGKLHYLVAGWYSDPAEEVFTQAGKTMAELLEQFRWKVDASAEALANLSRSVYTGKLYQVDVPSSKHASVAHYDGMKVAFGHNAIDAMIALIRQSAPQLPKETLQMLKAFQYGELERLHEPGGETRLARDIRKTWFKAQSNTIFWSLEKKESGETSQPSEADLDILETLNQAQAVKESEYQRLRQLQKMLYDAWWQLNTRKNNIPEGSELVAEITRAINELLDPAKGLAQKITGQQTLLANLGAQVETLQQTLEQQIASRSLTLEANAGQPYWQPNDPTLLISGITPPQPFDQDKELKCLLPSQLGAQPSATVFVDNEVFRLLTGWFESQQSSPPAPDTWRAPWDPVFVEWEAEWFSLPFQSQEQDLWSYDGTDYHLQLTAAQLQEQRLVKPEGQIVSGRSFLSPQNNQLFFRQLEALKKATPASERPRLEDLERFVNTITRQKFLSQPMSDFNLQLGMQQSQLGLIPEALKQLVGNEHQTQPFTPGRLPDDLAGIRQGQFKLNKLLVYDAFGQCITLVGGRGLKNERNFIPARDTNLVPDHGRTVMAWNTGRFLELKPRLRDSHRLAFDFVDANDRERVLHRHKSVNPVCGWLIHNHLDRSLAYFDNDGRYAGETRTIRGEVLSQISDTISNPVFREFVTGIPKDPQGFDSFRNLIDETLWTVHDNSATTAQHMAVWMGKPLALVLGRLYFQGMEPAGEINKTLVDTPLLFNYQNPAFLRERSQQQEDTSLNVRLGSQGIRQDGLIGYFMSGKFHSVNMRTQFRSDFVQPIDREGIAIRLSAPHYLPMLMVPGAGITAQSGLLPATELRLPDQVISDGLEKIKVHFRFQSLLTTVEQAAQQDEPPGFTLPAPALQNGNWQWEETGQPAPFRVVPTPGEMQFPATAAVIRDGKLVLQRDKKP